MIPTKPVWKVLGLCRPADLVQLMGVGRNHSLDRRERAPLAGDGDVDAVGQGAFGGHRMKRDLVHVDQMFAQRGDIDLPPRR